MFIPKHCLPFNNWRQLSAAAQNFRTILQKQLDDIHLAGTYKNERVISSPQKTVINIEGSSKSVVNFCANNYLGLSVCPKHFTIRISFNSRFMNFISFQCGKVQWRRGWVQQGHSNQVWIWTKLCSIHLWHSNYTQSKLKTHFPQIAWSNVNLIFLSSL